MKKILLQIILFVGVSVTATAQTTDTLQSGTMVQVSFSTSYCSNSSGQVSAFVASNVFSNKGKVLIRGGELVNVEVQRQSAGGFGKAGEIRVTAISTIAVDGTVVPLNGSAVATGEGNETLAWTEACGAAILIPVVGILVGFLVKGSDACLYNLPLVKTLRDVTVQVR